MLCAEFTERLDEYLEGALANADHEAAAAHLRGCADCQRRVARGQALRAALRNLPVETPRPEFFEQALARARGSNDARRWAWPTLAGLALAASLALWLGFGWLPGARLAGVTIALHEARTVQLAFNAEQELRQATLSIRLPDGVELQGFPGQREVRWRADLARGVNVLSLPLIATSTSGGTLMARVEHAERSTELSVQLRVNKSGRTGALPSTCVTADECQTSIKEVSDAHV